MPADCQSLDPDRILETARTLRSRISERFPEAGLCKVATEVEAACLRAAETAPWLGRPLLPIRIAVAVCITALMAALFGGASALKVTVLFSSLAELLQGMQAAVDNLAFVDIAVFFLVTSEGRLKRRRALKALHALRSLAHIIDMHQLTKDPERLMAPGTDTPSSPRRGLTAFELLRYLDYCSELLSLVSKIAALHVSRFDDHATSAAVNEIETLASGLSRKIWQKIMILDRGLAP
jgi:hypothetical protein